MISSPYTSAFPALFPTNDHFSGVRGGGSSSGTNCDQTCLASASTTSIATTARSSAGSFHQLTTVSVKPTINTHDEDGLNIEDCVSARVELISHLVDAEGLTEVDDLLVGSVIGSLNPGVEHRPQSSSVILPLWSTADTLSSSNDNVQPGNQVVDSKPHTTSSHLTTNSNTTSLTSRLPPLQSLMNRSTDVASSEHQSSNNFTELIDVQYPQPTEERDSTLIRSPPICDAVLPHPGNIATSATPLDPNAPGNCYIPPAPLPEPNSSNVFGAHHQFRRVSTPSNLTVGISFPAYTLQSPTISTLTRGNGGDLHINGLPQSASRSVRAELYRPNHHQLPPTYFNAKYPASYRLHRGQFTTFSPSLLVRTCSAPQQLLQHRYLTPEMWNHWMTSGGVDKISVSNQSPAYTPQDVCTLSTGLYHPNVVQNYHTSSLPKSLCKRKTGLSSCVGKPSVRKGQQRQRKSSTELPSRRHSAPVPTMNAYLSSSQDLSSLPTYIHQTTSTPNTKQIVTFPGNGMEDFRFLPSTNPSTNSRPEGLPFGQTTAPTSPTTLHTNGGVPLTAAMCAVCDSAASGNHYGVLTCEGCKLFFKRTIRKDLVYTCPAQKDCPLDNRFRNHCQYCRLTKCLKVGMRREAVHDEHVKTSLMSDNASSPSTASVDRSFTGFLDDNLTPISNNSGQDIPNTLVHPDATSISPHLPQSVMNNDDSNSLLPIVTPPQAIDSIQKAEEVIQSRRICRLKQPDNEIPPDHVPLLDLLAWSKHVPFFNQLPSNIQCSLLTSAWLELLLSTVLHHTSFISSDNQPSRGSGTALDPLHQYDGTIFESLLSPPPLVSTVEEDQISKQQEQRSLFSELITNFTNKLQPLRLDQIEMGCLKSIVLLNPDLPELPSSMRGQIESARDQLYAALEYHCTQLCSNSPHGRMGRLLLKIPLFHLLALRVKTLLAYSDRTIVLSNNLKTLFFQSSPSSIDLLDPVLKDTARPCSTPSQEPPSSPIQYTQL